MKKIAADRNYYNISKNAEPGSVPPTPGPSHGATHYNLRSMEGLFQTEGWNDAISSVASELKLFKEKFSSAPFLNDPEASTENCVPTIIGMLDHLTSNFETWKKPDPWTKNE